MTKKILIGLPIIGLFIIITMIFINMKDSSDDEGKMILCSGVTLLDNNKINSLMEYNGYYVKDDILYQVLQEHKSEIDTLIKGNYKTSFSFSNRTTYVVFSDKHINTGLIIYSDENGYNVVACEDVTYSIYYPKGSKGDISTFDYNRETDLKYTIKY